MSYKQCKLSPLDKFKSRYTRLIRRGRSLDRKIKPLMDALLSCHDLDIVETVEPLLPEGYYQFEFRIRAKYLAKLPDGCKGGKVLPEQQKQITDWAKCMRDVNSDKDKLFDGLGNDVSDSDVIRIINDVLAGK